MGPFLALVILVFYILFMGFINKLKRPKVSQFEILILRLKVFNPWISYCGFLKRGFDIFVGLFATSSLLIHFWNIKDGRSLALVFVLMAFCTKTFQLCNSGSLFPI